MKRLAQAHIPTPYGRLLMIAYGDSSEDRQPTIALRHEKNEEAKEEVPLRMHSECMTGDIFHSMKCDCGEQLEFALQYLQNEGGLIIYLRQEGRGIGMVEKLKAYSLQEKGYDTVDANVALGHVPDGRSYEDAVFILQDLGIKSVRLMTNNPEKIKAIEDSPIGLAGRIPVLIKAGPDNEGYLEVKKRRMNHAL